MNKLMKRGSLMLGIGSMVAFAIVGCNSGGGGAGGIGSTSGTVATVNGESIDKSELVSFLEATSGETALRQLINFQMVMQALKKAGQDVTDKEVDAAIEARKKESPQTAAQVDEVVQNGGARLDALRRSVRYQVALDKLITKDIKVDDKALQAWFDKHKADYGSPASIKFGMLISSSKPRADTMAQQLKTKSKTFAQLVEDQTKAKDPAAMRSTAEIPSEVPANALPPELKNPLEKLKEGETTPVILLTPAASPQKVYGILRLVKKKDAVNPSLADIKSQVETDYKLEQLARKVVAENPSNPKFEEAISRMGQALAMQNGGMPPAQRDVLRSINQTAVNNELNNLQKTATVQIDDPMYKALADSFKAAAATPAAPVAGATPGAASGATPAAASPAAATAAPAAP